MSVRLVFTIGLGMLAVAVADDPPRFSTGPIHSGTVEIELDISGAQRFSIGVTGAGAEIEWIGAQMIDADGSAAVLEKPNVIKAGNRRVIDIAKKNYVKFAAEVRVDHKGEDSSRIEIYHDAPRPPVPEIITKFEGDASRGRNVFGRGTCSSCHVIDGRGGEVGPDLSELGERSELGSIIESIIAPDAVLAAGFETSIITMKDGTPHLGFVVADRKESLSIKDSAGQIHEIDKRAIVLRQAQTFSMMPPFGELFSPQQIADLAAFLKGLQK